MFQRLLSALAVALATAGFIPADEPLKKLVLSGHTTMVKQVAWSPDGKVLASAGDRTVRLWDPTTGKQTAEMETPLANTLGVTWSPDGKTLASGASDGRVRLWDATTGKQRHVLEYFETPWIRTPVWSPDGKVIVGTDFKNLNFWDAATGKLLRKCDQIGQTHDRLAWKPDGSVVAAAYDPYILLIDPETTKTIKQFTLVGDLSILHIAWSPDGKSIAVAHGKELHLLDASTGQVTRTVRWPNRVEWAAWRPDGKELAASEEDGTVHVWDPSTRKETEAFKAHRGGVYAVAWRPDGKALATAGADKTVGIWPIPSGK